MKRCIEAGLVSTDRMRAAKGGGAARLLAWTVVLLAAIWVVAGAGAGMAGAQTAPGGALAERLAGGPLTDLPTGHWAYRALDELSRAGVVVEYAPGLLDGERTISRYEAAMLIVAAFQRHGAVVAAGAGANTVALKGLSLPQLMARWKAQGSAGTSSPEDAVRILTGLGREFAGELEVLGYRLVTAEDQATDRPTGSPSTGVMPAPGLRAEGSAVLRLDAVAVSGTAAHAGPGAAGGEDDTAGASPTRPAAPAAGGGSRAPGPAGTVADLAPSEALARQGGQAAAPSGGEAASRLTVTPTYRLSLRSVEPGRYAVAAQIASALGSSTTLPDVNVDAVVNADNRWLLTRWGWIQGAYAGRFAMAGTVGLEGLEARLVNQAGGSGLVVARTLADPLRDPEGHAVNSVAVVDSSVRVSEHGVVGAAIVRSGAPGELSQDWWPAPSGETVASVFGQFSPQPWLTLGGEYAQNLWAVPLFAAAMRLDARLMLGDVRLGASVQNVPQAFRAALGTTAPGRQVGVDAAVRLGDVEVKAGTGRRTPPDGAPDEVARSVGVAVGALPDALLEAGYEWITVEDLAAKAASDRSRVQVRVGWGLERVRWNMGVSWEGGARVPPQQDPSGAGGWQAEAGVSYQLNPYTTVILGYRLIDFQKEDGQPVPTRADAATAQVTLRF